MQTSFHYKFIRPEEPLDDFVERIGMFENASDDAKEVIIMPDGRIDLFFSRSASEPFHATLVGLETFPGPRSIPARTLAFVISFKPLALEYILKMPIADILDRARILPDGFWDFTADDLNDFETFDYKARQKITTLLPEKIDARKRRLFNLIYSSNGEMAVHELSQKSGWSSRQINRYFSKYLGMPLQTFCKILRFRASLEHIAQGRIFPELNFTDQAHFIREIKRFSGVAPKALLRNHDDRFILLSVLKQQ